MKKIITISYVDINPWKKLIKGTNIFKILREKTLKELIVLNSNIILQDALYV